MYHLLGGNLLFDTVNLDLRIVPAEVAGLFANSEESLDETHPSDLVHISTTKGCFDPPAVKLAGAEEENRRIEHLVLNVTRQCNLCCTYCYSSQTSNLQATLSGPAGLRAVQAIKSLPCSNIKLIKFLGGEPLLAFPSIRHIVEGTVQLFENDGHDSPKFVIVTNGTILQDEIVEFLRQHQFTVFVSFDGNAAVHDSLRPDKGTRPTYSRVLSTIRHLLGCGIDVRVECVYTGLHLAHGIKPLDIAKGLGELGIRYFAIHPVVGQWHQLRTEADNELIIGHFRHLVRYSVLSLTSDSPLVVSGIQFVIESLLEGRQRPHFCEAGTNLVSIDADGRIYPCYLLQSTGTEMGDVSELDYERLFRVRQQFLELKKWNSTKCAKCWAVNICKPCLGVCFLEGHDLPDMPDWFCDFQRAMIEEAITAFVELQSSSSGNV